MTNYVYNSDSDFGFFNVGLQESRPVAGQRVAEDLDAAVAEIRARLSALTRFGAGSIAAPIQTEVEGLGKIIEFARGQLRRGDDTAQALAELNEVVDEIRALATGEPVGAGDSIQRDLYTARNYASSGRPRRPLRPLIKDLYTRAQMAAAAVAGAEKAENLSRENRGLREWINTMEEQIQVEIREKRMTSRTAGRLRRKAYAAEQAARSQVDRENDS